MLVGTTVLLTLSHGDEVVAQVRHKFSSDNFTHAREREIERERVLSGQRVLSVLTYNN